MWAGRGTGTVVQMAAGGCLSSPLLDAAVTPSSGEAPHYCCLATHTCMVNQCDQRSTLEINSCRLAGPSTFNSWLFSETILNNTQFPVQ